MPSDGLSSIPQPRSRYTKAQCIGRGASKVVYKAFDEVEGIEVAWNEVVCSDACLGSGKERTRMLGEITMLKQLKHRNIMRLYDWWFDKQQQVLVFITELLTDGSLRRFIRRKHSAGITLSALKRYAWQILQGLVYLHGHYPAIIHRDLKCDNIFVNGASGELKLGDLGFATLLRGMSCPLSVIGTPEFMAPELYDEHYDEKVDIYSFGMCLLELATLQYPYSECTNPAQIYRKVTRGIPPAALEDVQNTALRELIMLTINPEPRQRPEARQLLVHPFFADVVQAIRAKGWAKGPAPALGAAAAAAAAAASGPRGAAQAAAQAAAAAAATGVPVNGEVLLAPAGLAAAAGAHRVPVSAPDGGLAAIAAAAEAAAAAGDAAGGSSAAAPGLPHPCGSEPVGRIAHGLSAVADGQLQLDAGSSSPASADLALPRSWPKDSSTGAAALLLHDAMMADVAQQSDQQQAGSSSSSNSRAAADVASIQHHQQQEQASNKHFSQKQQLLQQQEQLSSDGSYPEITTTSVSWPPQEASTAALPAIQRTISSTSTCSCTPTVMHSPFEAVSQCSFTSNSSWSSGRGKQAGSSSSTVGAGGSGDVAGHAAAAAVHWRQQRGRAPSLDEMSEEDVLFDADSQGTHGEEDCDSEHEDGPAPKAQTVSGVWQNIHQHPSPGHSQGKQQAQQQQQQQQQRYLDPIHEDGDDDDDDVDCVCRQIDQQQLSFNVGFFNTTGMRKRVGFQYNADEDTVEDVTMEMLENLSLMPQQANAIAEKIRAALEVLGLPHNGRTAAAAVAAAAAASSGGSTPSHAQVTGESAAIAIVATAAASAAIESCGTPQPGGSVDLDAGTASGSTGTPCSFGLLGLPDAAGIAAGAAPTSRTGSGLLAAAAAAAAAAAGSSPASSSIGHPSGIHGLAVTAHGSAAGAGGVSDVLGQLACTQQLVRELSMLDKEAGTALLQNLQEELLVQSLAMPEAAAAVGVELGVSLSG